MEKQENRFDDELTVIQTVLETLNPLEPDSRQRVVEYVAARLEISTAREGPPDLAPGRVEDNEIAPESGKKTTPQVDFDTFAELFDAARPHDNGQKALVAGYWVQECDGADTFSGFSINKALKDLGYGILNITNAFDSLKRQTPALVVQLKKSGKSRQARKAYKITKAGIKAVETMISE